MESYQLVHLLFTIAHANNFFLEQLELEFPFWKCYDRNFSKPQKPQSADIRH